MHAATDLIFTERAFVIIFFTCIVYAGDLLSLITNLLVKEVHNALFNMLLLFISLYRLSLGVCFCQNDFILLYFVLKAQY